MLSVIGVKAGCLERSERTGHNKQDAEQRKAERWGEGGGR